MLLKEKNYIVAWLDKYKVKNYTLRPDETYGYVVDVVGDVFLGNKNLTEICIKFGKVSGYFDCSYNRLTSLEGSPVHVEGNFYCADNQLISLHGSPQHIGINFNCNNNKLTSLEGCPRHVVRVFCCHNNQLTSLEGMPDNVGAGLYCAGNSELGELQEMTDFKAIQAYLLSEKLANDLNIKDNNRKVKL